MADHDWSRTFRASCYARGPIAGPSPLARVRFSTFPALAARRPFPARLATLLRALDREPGTLASAVAAIRSAVPGWRVEVRQLAGGGSISVSDPNRLIAYPLGFMRPEPMFAVLWFGRAEAGRLGGPSPAYAGPETHRPSRSKPAHQD